MYTQIADSRKNIRKVKHILARHSRKLYRQSIDHNTAVNDLGQLARLIKGKQNESPETLKWVTDDNDKPIRPAHTIQEQSEQTLKQQNKQMSPHEGTNCHFLDLIRDKECPEIITGLQCNPDKPFTKESMRQWKPNMSKQWYTTNYPKVKQAHENMRQLFTTKEDRRDEYNWPWYLDRDTMEFSDPKIEENFRKMLATRPGKARHNNFTLQVLGRLPQ